MCRLNLPLRRPWNKEEVEELVFLLLGRPCQPTDSLTMPGLVPHAGFCQPG